MKLPSRLRKWVNRLRMWLRHYRWVTLRLSDDKKLYYVEGTKYHAEVWMGNAIEGAVPENLRKDRGVFAPAYVEINAKGRVYHRSVYHFGWWKIGSRCQYRERVRMDDDRVLDYEMHHQRG